MSKKFILQATKLKHIGDNEQPIIRVSREAYDLLVDMANESGLTLSKVASKAIKYASENVCYERSEE